MSCLSGKYYGWEKITESSWLGFNTFSHSTQSQPGEHTSGYPPILAMYDFCYSLSPTSRMIECESESPRPKIWLCAYQLPTRYLGPKHLPNLREHTCPAIPRPFYHTFPAQPLNSESHNLQVRRYLSF